jgi:hypothetical protein
VIGYLPGYLREEHYDRGGRFLLVSLAGLPAAATVALAVAAAAALVTWVVARCPPPPGGAALLVGGLLLVATPVQPWYAVTLLALATVAAQPVWACVAAAGYPYFFAVILDHPATTRIGQAGYGTALLVVVAVLTRDGRRPEGSLGAAAPDVPGRRRWRRTPTDNQQEAACELSSPAAPGSSAATS